MVEKLENRMLLSVITNSVTFNTFGYVGADVGGGGGLNSVKFSIYPSVVLGGSSYTPYLDLGTGNKPVGMTTQVVTLDTFSNAPINIDAHTARSTSTIAVDTGVVGADSTITVIATTTLPANSLIISTDYQFTAHNFDLRKARVLQYLDADIMQFNRNVFTVDGSIESNSLSISTVDPTNNIWVSQANGVNNFNAQLQGFAADSVFNLGTKILAGAYNPPAAGDINIANLPNNPNQPVVGNAWGPGDVTSVLNYGFQSMNTATISTRLVMFAAAEVPFMQVLGNGIGIPDGDVTRSVLDNTDFGTVASFPIQHGFQIRNRGLMPLVLPGDPLISIAGASASAFTVIRQPTSVVGGGQNTSFTIEYVPDSPGLHTALVSIRSNDLTSTPYTFTIFAGSGTETQLDAYEIDDTPQQAKVISSDGVFAIHSIHRSADVDWSKFTIGRATDLVIETNVPDGSGEMSIRLFNSSILTDPAAVEIARGTTATVDGQTRVNLSQLAAGTYYIKTYKYGQNTTVPLYQLAVRSGASLTDSPVVLDAAGQLAVRANNNDNIILLKIFGSSIQVTVDNQQWYVGLSQVKSIFINGRPGNDTIKIGPGIISAVIHGSQGNDTILGHDGNDTIYGDLGNDSLVAGSGDVMLFGGAGNDTLRAGSGNDYVSGDAGNDLLAGGVGSDTMVGGSGCDTIISGTGPALIDTRDGEIDTIYADLPKDQVFKDSFDILSPRSSAPLSLLV